MKNLIILLTLLFSFSALGATGISSGGGTAAIANTVTVAGRVINLDDPNVKVGSALTTASLNYDTMKIYTGATIDYASVPIGKQWELLGIRCKADGTAGTATNGLFGHGTGVEDNTNDPVGGDVLGCDAPGATNYFMNVTIPSNAAGEIDYRDFYCPHVVPQGNYPFMRFNNVSNSVHCIFYYLEEDA